MSLEYIKNILSAIKGTILHPQWLSDRYHILYKHTLNGLCNKTILDVGSGNSNYPKRLMENNQFITLDYPVTNSRYMHKPDIYGTACMLPFADNSFDVLLCFEVLEHIQDSEKALKEIKRIVKTGGYIYISVPFIYPAHDIPFDFRRYTYFGIKNEIEKIGLDIIYIKQNGNSLLAVIQLLNITILEIIRSIYTYKKIVGLTFMLIFYPLCIMLNIVGILFLKADGLSASCFGYHLKVTKKV